MIRFILTLVVLFLQFPLWAQNPDSNAPKKKLRVGEIPEEERGRIKSRVESLSFTTFGFGPAGATDMNNSKMFYAFQFGKNWEVGEMAEIRSSLSLQFPSKDSGYFVMGGLGGSFIPITTDISPIVGAELGFGTSGGKDISSKTGFGYSLYGGVRLFRTSNTQLSIEAFYRGLFEKDSPKVYGALLNIHF